MWKDIAAATVVVVVVCAAFFVVWKASTLVHECVFHTCEGRKLSLAVSHVPDSAARV